MPNILLGPDGDSLCLRYFADNVREDYAAGQLDAQVCAKLLLQYTSSLFLSFLGGRHSPRDEGAVDLWRKLGNCCTFWTKINQIKHKTLNLNKGE
jgi:hypothetical protein